MMKRTPWPGARWSRLLIGIWAVVLLWLTPPNAAAAALPAGFVEETIGGAWNEAVGLVFAPDGRMFVWERSGKVWLVENGVKSAAPFLDISEEVAVWNNYGLLGFCLHPDFLNNGYIYLLYTADRHYVRFFGTAGYDPRATETHVATIGRITRYTAQASDGFHSVDLASRRVLLGEGLTNGFPLVSGQHGVGSLLFGADGTLLASCGDGASSSITDVGNGSGTYYQQALADGIIEPRENIGAYRCQLVNGLNGKILRLDAGTGDGVPGNPFFDAAQPRAARSRVWALGLKTPCRVTLRPGTGSHHVSDANPGSLYIGDVGWNDWEDLNVCNGPGMNFGWPAYEGMEIQPSYYNSNVANRDAPNPLFGTPGCTLPYFYFRDLIKQPTLGAPSWPNPCSPGQQIPSTIQRFIHARPAIDWKHGSGPARTASFTGTNASVITVGVAGSPVQGSSFGGACSIGGVWYTGSDFPAIYSNSYFHADYVGEWIKNFVFDANDAPVQVREFATGAGGVVFIATHPIDGALYYISWTSTLKRVRYVGTGNQAPTAVAAADRIYGPGPLTVRFTGTNSVDPEKLPLSFLWDFADGSPPDTNANPTHLFNVLPGAPTRFDVKLKVTDRGGATNVTSVLISVNNSPPVVRITSPTNGTLYSVSGDSMFACTALVNDVEHTQDQLSYAWQTILHHNTHIHSEPVDPNPSTTTTLSPEGCDGQTYYYSVILTVTDAAGLSSTDEVRLFPDCRGAPPPAPLPAGSLNPSLPPGRNFDLSHWYLGTPDPGRSLSIPAADLMAGYTNAWFYTGPDGAMVFWAPVTGGTTPNSTFPRSELREQINPPDNDVNWTAFGTHVLDAQCKVTKLPSTGKVIIGQVHGVLGDARPLLKFVFNTDNIDAQVKASPAADPDLHVSFPNIPFNSLITYRIVLQDGTLMMTVNGVTQSVDIFASDPAWSNQTFYFKAGSYCQDASGPATEGGQVEFYQLNAAHGSFTALPPTLTKSPSDTSVPIGSNVVLSVSAVGGLPLDYQWFKDGTRLMTANNSILPIYNCQPFHAGMYRAVISNPWGAATSAVAVLTVITNLQPISLSEAVDATNLVWTTTGVPAWEGHYSTSHDGLDAARSGVTPDGATVSLQTTVTGPGTLSFWWKISSETNADFLTLFFNTTQQARISGGVEWEQRTFNVPAGSQVIKWSYSKNASAYAGQDRGWLDQVQFTPSPLAITSQPTNRTVNAGSTATFSVAVAGTPPFTYQWLREGIRIIESATMRGTTTASLVLSNVQPVQAGNYSVSVSNATSGAISSNALLTVTPVFLLGEALDAPGAIWTTNGSPSWNGQGVVTHDGEDAAQTGPIADGKSGYIQMTVMGPRTVSFWWKVSSETNKDLLAFAVGGTEQARISGEVEWQQRSFNVGAGSQALRWTYTKNGSIAKGQDRAWVDQVRLLPDAPPVAPTGLVATPVSNTRIDLRWNDNAADESGYGIERSSNGVAFTRIAAVGSNVTSYANTGLLAGATWVYRVAASNVVGFSSNSVAATATTPHFPAIHINFQPASSPVPPGYLVDSGAIYGDRGNGLVYGWNNSGTSNTKDRNSTRSPDQRYDTYISSQKSSGTKWDLALPNGFYEVVLVAGDPTDAASDYRFTVQGQLAMNAKPTTANPWVTGRIAVPVTTGRLTVSNAFGSVNNRLCFIDATRRSLTVACPADKTLSLGSAWEFDLPGGAADYCPISSNIVYTVASTATNTTGLCGKSFRAVRTWVATDACGNTNSCTQAVTVLDTTAPSMHCGVARTVESGSPWVFDAPVVYDDADGTNVAVQILFTVTNRLCGSSFAVTRSWSATDRCGNSNTCQQTISIIDTIPPVLSCRGPRTNEWGTDWAFDIPGAVDAVDGTNLTLSLLFTTTNVLCGKTYEASQTWSAADACGNSNICTQVVTVVDTTPPTLNCSPTRVIEWGTPWTFDDPVSFDLTDGTDVAISLLSTVTNELCGTTFMATRTWVAYDACGNSATCQQMVRVVDNTPPVVTCSADRTIEGGANWDFDFPNAMDAANGTNVGVRALFTTTNALCGGSFVATRVWSASDGCGNSAVCTQVITIIDTTPPSISCGASHSVEAGSPWTFEDPIAMDQAEGTNVVVVILSTTTNAACGATFSATRIWSATDGCGNSNICSQVITVIDSTPPSMACAPSRTVEWDTDWSFEPPIANDVADGTNVTVTVVSTVTNVLCGRTFQVTRTWMATDACGNIGFCSQTVVLVDTKPPAILCPPSITLEWGTPWTFSIATALDDLDGTNVSLVVLVITTNALCGKTYAAVQTWSATDACGNSNVCSQTITIVDTTPPALACAASRTFEWGVPWTFELPVPNDLADETNVAVAVVSTVTNMVCGSTFVATRTWSAMDACGNSNVCSQTVTVIDTTPPAIVCVDVITCDPSIPLSATVVDSSDPHPSLFCIRDDGRLLTAPFPAGITTVTCMAMDACGNSNICPFTVTVLAPVTAPGLVDQVVYSGSDVVMASGASGAGPLTFVWRWNGAIITGATTETLMLPEVSMGSVGSYCVEITGACHSITNCATLGVIEQRVGFCIVGQGAYADVNGQIHGVPTLEMLGALVGPSTLTLGKAGVRAVTIHASDIPLLATRLPAAGPAAALAGDNDDLPLEGLPLNPKGKLDNSLLGQTLVLALNCRLDITFPDFIPTEWLCTRAGDPVRSFAVPVHVLDSMAALTDATVAGLLELANRALAGLPTGVASLAEIKDAVEAVNEAFDGCRLLVTCSPLASAVPANDNFASRSVLPVVAASPPATIIAVARNTGASFEAGEPLHPSNRGGKSVWWQWTPSTTGRVRISTFGSSFDTLLSVYTGGNFAELTSIAANDDNGVSAWAEASFEVVAGTAYQISVDGYAAEMGTVILTITSVP